MRSLLCTSLLAFLISCGTETMVPSNKEGTTSTTTPTPSSTPTSSTTSDTEKEKPLGLCSFETSKARGCLKAAIASTQLVVGPLSYDFGIKDLNREFANDLLENNYLELPEGASKLKLVKDVTPMNFHDGFYIIVEGSSTTYGAYNAGDGNLKVDSMVPGHYYISFYRDFDLKFTNSAGTTIDYACVVIFARREVSIEVGKETMLSSQIGEFELKVYEGGSCSGLTIKK